MELTYSQEGRFRNPYIFFVKLIIFMYWQNFSQMLIPNNIELGSRDDSFANSLDLFHVNNPSPCICPLYLEYVRLCDVNIVPVIFKHNFLAARFWYALNEGFIKSVVFNKSFVQNDIYFYITFLEIVECVFLKETQR